MKLMLALAACLAATPAAAETAAGPAIVIDGDALEVGNRKVRLFGIDAPEAGQTCDRNGEVWACGGESERQLREIVGTNPVQCTGHEIDQYGRLVAVCSAGGYELNRTMVEQGWATAFRSYSDAYVAAETRAKAARLGIWASTFDLPQNYRLAEQGLPLESAQPPAPRSQRRQQASQGGCVIKGNRNRRGEWIYHLPGKPYYEQTRAEEMFCTEAQAQAAGYRRSRAQ